MRGMAKLYFKYGVMGSSKTAQALITKFNYEERGMSVWLIKHPQAADSVGINVYRMRYAGVSISGILGGIGGFFYAVGVMDGNTNGHTGVAGFGFLALAVLIFGQWKPIPILFAALFFAFLRTVAYSVALIPFLKALNINQDYYKMLPYVATMVVLAFTSKRSRAPKAEGIPYDKGMR